jgi:lipid-binding SYLF domain-containing protein
MAEKNSSTMTTTATTEQQQQQQEQAKKGLFSTLQEKASKVAHDVANVSKDVANKAKQAMEDTHDKMEDRLTMEGQLKEAHESLARFLNPEIELEKQIPAELMKSAKGIVLLTVLKASVGIGGSVGSGIVITQLEQGAGWSQPCSIGIMGGQWGLNIGAQKTNFVIILRDEMAVKVFTAREQIKFGVDASMSAGPLGRNAQIAMNANDKGYTATVSYSESQGLYVGVALEGSGITVRNECNEQYYGKKMEVKDILGAVGVTGKNADYDAIISILTQYIAAAQRDEQMEKPSQDDQKDDQKDDQ